MKKKLLAMLAVLILGAWAHALADQVKLGSDGVLHRIEVVTLEGSTETDPRTSLCHTMQKADGTVVKTTIPATNDLAADLDPQIDLNPSNQLPTVVWSRFDGTDFEIALSSFDGSRWSAPKLLTSNGNNDRESRIIIGKSNLFHLMWKEETPGLPTFYHINLSDTGSPAVAPDIRYAPESNLVLPDGTTPPTSTYPSDSSNFFAFLVTGFGVRRLVVWGGRDDPSPISFEEGFKLQDSISDITTLKAQKVNSRLVVIFRSGDQLYYTYRTQSSWTDYRMIHIDNDVSEGRAEQLIKEMLSKLS